MRMTLSELIEKLSLEDARMVAACVRANVTLFLVDQDDFMVMAASSSRRLLDTDNGYTLVEVVPE